MGKRESGNKILMACILFNLSIGVVHGWSVLKSALMQPLSEGGFNFTSSQAGLPYVVVIVCFSLGLLIGGSIQDRIGPRFVMAIGGFMVGAGYIIASFAGANVIGLTLGYGVISGLGVGFGYGSACPVALKWFSPKKKGLVSGLVVGGFGMAAVYLAPLTSYLIDRVGIPLTFRFIGIGIIIFSVPLALIIHDPPLAYEVEVKDRILPKENSGNYSWKEMLKTKQFYLLFILFALSSSVGLMVIGNITKIGILQVGLATTAWLVMLLGVANTAGRIIAGVISDHIGRIPTMFIVFSMQLINMVFFALYHLPLLLIIGTVVGGFAYGALSSIFPSIMADYYGLKHYGNNYGIFFLSWGLSGVLAPPAADYIFDLQGSFNLSYMISVFLLVFALIFAFILKREGKPEGE